MLEDTEENRYVEYLQKQLVTEGSEDFLEEQSKWLRENRHTLFANKIGNHSVDTSLMRFMEWTVQDLSTQGPYQDVFGKRIFEPLLEKLLKLAEEHKIAPKLPIYFSTSPAVDASPAAVPSSERHLLFAGQGTYSFCNYWGKIYTLSLQQLAGVCRRKHTAKYVLPKLVRRGVIGSATSLAWRYATRGSVLGIGKLAIPDKLSDARMLMVTAMEVFILGHEIGHFLLQEDFPDTNGTPPDWSEKDVELHCDVVGLALCTSFGKQEGNPFAYQFIGPLLFFSAMEVCQRVSRLIGTRQFEESSTHPSHAERIQNIFDFVKTIKGRPRIRPVLRDCLRLSKALEFGVLANIVHIASRSR